jgi:hypothetical protein
MNDTKNLILAFREALHSKDFDYLSRHREITEDILNDLFKKNEGNEVWMHFRNELIEIIDATNQINGFNSRVKDTATDKRVTVYMFPPLSGKIIQQVFSVIDASDVDKSWQLSKGQDFIIDGNRKRISEKGRMKFEHHNQCVRITTTIEIDPTMLKNIRRAASRASSSRLRVSQDNYLIPSQKMKKICKCK